MSDDGRKEQQRANPRRRTRLRSGKVANIKDEFIVECQIFDRSQDGARLRLAHAADLPEHIRLFDDEQNALLTAVVVWKDGLQAGVRFAKGKGMVETSGTGHAALGGKYYAV